MIRYSAVLISGATAMLVAAACAPPPRPAADFGSLRIVAERESPHSHLVVADGPHHRYLFADGVLQTGVARHPDISAAIGSLLESGDYFELLPFLHVGAERMLLIGLGGGLHARILSKYGIEVDCVEIDPVVVALAREHFGFRGRAVVMDGRRYIEQTAARYDIIAIDAFAGDTIPFHLLTREMILACERALNGTDSILAIHYLGDPRGPIPRSIVRTLRTAFTHVTVYASDGADGVSSLYVFASDAILEPDPVLLPTSLARRVRRAEIRIACGERDPVYTDDCAPLDTGRGGRDERPCQTRSRRRSPAGTSTRGGCPARSPGGAGGH